MDVRLSHEQIALAMASDRFARDLAERWSQGRAPATSDPSIPDGENWQRIIDIGWLAVRMDEESGGAAGSCLDVCVFVEQLGRHALAAPVLGPVLALEQLRLRGAPPELIESIVVGDRRVAPTLTGDLLEFAMTGTGAVVIDASEGAMALVLGADPVEMPIEIRPSTDLTRAFGVTVGEPISLPVGPPTSEIRTRELAFALTIVAADLLGLMSMALERALEHARVRHQFGKAIGSFQAIKHLLAEAHVSVEATRSAVWYSAWAVDALEPDAALVAARTAKAFASARGVEVVETAIQTLGGIGMTWESFAHVWQRRIHLDRRLFGDEFAQYAGLATERKGK